jgi:hypothetical protein
VSDPLSGGIEVQREGLWLQECRLDPIAPGLGHQPLEGG